MWSEHRVLPVTNLLETWQLLALAADATRAGETLRRFANLPRGQTQFAQDGEEELHHRYHFHCPVSSGGEGAPSHYCRVSYVQYFPELWGPVPLAGEGVLNHYRYCCLVAFSAEGAPNRCPVTLLT